MNKKIIGNIDIGDPVIVYENALLCYLYGRVSLSTDWFLFILPSIFYFFHHAIEISIKTLLTLKNIKYPSSGSKGHKIYQLLILAVESSLFSNNVNDLLKNKDLVDILENMDNSYLNNKYAFPGYQIDIPLRDLIDEIIFTLFQEINLILATKIPKHAPAKLYVPKCVEENFLYKLKKPFSYTVLDKI